MMSENQSSRVKMMILLHLMLMIYSMSGICSKMAAGQDFLSWKFCFFYGIVIVLLGFYALAWQQVIKRMPLTTAFANKAVTVIWGLVWGLLFFHEAITPGKVVGVLMIVAGIVIFSKADGEEKKEEKE